MGEVKRYDPINSDGTCGMCIEDAGYGAYVEYADYAALEAELAKLRAGQEPDEYPPCDYCGVITDYHPWHGSGFINGRESPHIHACNECRHLLPSAPQPSAVPDVVAILDEVREFCRLSGYLDVVRRIDALADDAPSAPATVQGDWWIPVSERLPTAEQGTVAVLTDDGAILTAWASYWSGARTDFAYWTFPHGDDDDSVVTHWMPLPAAPAIAAARQEGGNDRR